jgi:MFS family permease
MDFSGFRALRYRNYRLFFLGQSISLIGTWMQVVAVSWLVYHMTNSAFLLGVVAFSGQIPILLISPFAGVLADNFQRKPILVTTQTLLMIQALFLAVLALTGTIEVWHIIVLSILLGLINAFDAPARQAFVVDMVENKEDLGNAIALNSFTFNGARLLGPSIAGILIAIVGEGMCFLLNGLSFIAVIAALLAMKIKPKNIKIKNGDFLSGLKEGFAYAFGFAAIRDILLLVALVSLIGMSYIVIMPIFARDILGGGPQTLGFLMGATGVGAIAGALYIASRKSVNWKDISGALIVFGVGLTAFSLSRILWLSLLLILCVGFGMMVQMVSSNTVIQSLTDDDKRGRVMSLYIIAFLGMAPLGSLLTGSLAARIGAQNTILLNGLVSILGSMIFIKKFPLLKEK